MDKKTNRVMKTKGEDLNLAKLYITHVKESGIPISQAFLFGSRARGTAHRFSDLDICIVSPAFGHDRMEERLHLMRLRNAISDLIEPHPFSPEDFQDPYDSLAVQIKTTGLQIF